MSSFPPPDGVVRHWNEIAADYDRWKRKNTYYYDGLKRLLSQHVAPGLDVLDIGCGTGELLAHVKPARGVGVDSSPEMVARGQAKHPQLAFVVASAEHLTLPQRFDAVLMMDILEHLSDPWAALSRVPALLKPGGRVVMTTPNPFWEPAFRVLEAARMKMPEGPHQFVSMDAVAGFLPRLGLRVEASGHRLLVPAPFPGSHALNHSFHRLPGLRKLGLIQFVVAGNRMAGPAEGIASQSTTHGGGSR